MVEEVKVIRNFIKLSVSINCTEFNVNDGGFVQGRGFPSASGPGAGAWGDFKAAGGAGIHFVIGTYI